MLQTSQSSCPGAPAIETYLLGRIDHGDCLALQQRLIYECGGRSDGQIALLLCEHPELITIGRNGSRREVRLAGSELSRRGLELKWVARGGGCILHAPGQLAIYPILSLDWRRWTVGEYLARFQHGISETLTELGFATTTLPGRFGLWGRSGQLAAMGAAVSGGISHQGAFLNVSPARSAYGYVDAIPLRETSPGERTTMGSLVAERGRPVKMTSVRATLIEKLSSAFDADRSHLYSGHPLLREVLRVPTAPTARAS